MKKERLFKNRETDTYMTMEEVKAIFMECRDSFHETIEEFLNDALSKNGSLEEVENIRFLNMEEDLSYGI